MMLARDRNILFDTAFFCRDSLSTEISPPIPIVAEFFRPESGSHGEPREVASAPATDRCHLSRRQK